MPASIQWYRFDPAFTTATLVDQIDDFISFGANVFVDHNAIAFGPGNANSAIALDTANRKQIVSTTPIDGYYLRPDFAVDETRRLIFVMGAKFQVLDLDRVLHPK